MSRDQYYGIIEEKYDDRDYLASDFDIFPRAPKGTDSFLKNGATQYDQTEVSKVSCTVHAAMGAYSDLTGFKFPLEARKEIWAEAINRGANEIGWYTNAAVKLVREWVNANCDTKVDFYRMKTGGNLFGIAMRLGYSPIVGYRGNMTYNIDRNDGVLDSTEPLDATYGHLLRTAYSKGDEFDIIIDNYPYRNTNIYLVPTSNWKKLVENKIFYENAYIYTLQ